ncbi:MAG: Trm112 family protein [Candidatus Aenigmatarchaeota archaeon]|nr:Trm112 family protein [Candidatus Aenigmarchaeota archaeon]
MPVKKELLEILACPKCKGDVEEKEMFLLCKKCKLAFPVIENIPDMLLDDAWKISKAEKNEYKHNLKL